MLSVEEARAQIVEAATALSWFDIIDIGQAYKRILAVDCISSIDVPSADNSAMDGYAIRLPLVSQELRISQTIAAGDNPEPLEEGTAARILTGATIPSGANAVVMQENCDVSEHQVRVIMHGSHGDNIRPKGQDIQSGAIVLKKGSLITAAALGVLASCGIDKVTVMERPKVAVVNTGSELAMPGKPIKPGQIYSSNQYFLSALLHEWGCEVVSNTQLPDNLERTKETLQILSEEVDLIITSGGVSVGDKDYVKPAIEALGKIDFWKICMKPGKPLAFGNIHSGRKAVPIIGLPGNPVSAFVTAVLFAKPFIEGLLGRKYRELKPLFAPANFATKRVRQRPEYIRSRLCETGLMPFKNQSSGVLTSILMSDALCLVPQDKTIQKGDMVAYYPMHLLTHLD